MEFIKNGKGGRFDDGFVKQIKHFGEGARY